MKTEQKEYTEQIKDAIRSYIYNYRWWLLKELYL